MERSLFWRFIRGFVYLFGAGLILYFQLAPGKFDEQAIYFQHSLFVWTAAFINRRPGSASFLAVCIVAVFYATYIEEGIALGAIALLMMDMLLRKFRSLIHSQTLFVEYGLTLIVFALVMFVKNLFLYVFLIDHYSLIELGQIILSFIISYPFINMLIVALVRSRK